ncbi:hypothetical protein L1O03_02790 [Corynebacterium uropygiale]|uniref:Uncharacterized protein n=1 Tax=Corynebacterium uropygiale TaxID=1775911 RepID=A0A9X1QSA6_9CORY|nr:hypothetical protein [Corynebacterium uropygiale]MCF4006105.1 hypothetical protein [Corynebacterium uropygiale]
MEPGRGEVGDADRAEDALAVEVFEVPPRAIDVAEGLVEENEVDLLHAQSLEGLLHAASGEPAVIVIDPHLRREEELLAGKARGAQALADALPR